MQLFTEIVGLVIALISLVTAIYAYRSTRLKEISSSPASNVKLIRIVGEPISKWKWRLLQGTFLLLGLIEIEALVRSISLVSEIGMAAVWILAVHFPVVLLYPVALWKLLRRRPWEEPSLVKRKTSLEVQADLETVFSQCEIALRKIGARITQENLTRPVFVAEQASARRG